MVNVKIRGFMQVELHLRLVGSHHFSRIYEKMLSRRKLILGSGAMAGTALLPSGALAASTEALKESSFV